MASKLVALVAIMATLVVMTHATIITTEIEIEDGSRIGTGQCGRQLRSQWPNHCEMYIMQGMRRYNQGKQYFDQCCNDLRRMQPQCQCEAMEMMMEKMRMEVGEPMMYKMMDKAMNLPKRCRTMDDMCPMSSMQ